MLARVFSCAILGLDGVVVEVEVDTGQGLPAIIIVGLPDAAVQESRERVQMAIKNAGLLFPRKRITVNLAPAAVRKEGPAYDLPIAVGILLATEQVSADLAQAGLVGELSLDGSVRHVRGILSMAALGREKEFQRIFVPEPDAALIQALNDGASDVVVAEVFVSITCLEFAYTQAPKTMKSLVMSLFLMSVARKPGVSLSTMNPRTSPSSFAQTIARSAIVPLVIQYFEPLSR